jgi:probable DNA metabolism protein
LFSVSADAYGAALNAWMSEYPIETEILHFMWKILSFARAAAGRAPGDPQTAARAGAKLALGDRDDPPVRPVLEAAYKVRHETDRLMGFLRFSPGEGGVYTARCAPDHYTLPALAAHFTRRFGKTPWLIVDEKRALALCGRDGGAPRLIPAGPLLSLPPAGDPWEELWRNYHRSINNESRKNPGLQRQFMPPRYWKYLPELAGKDRP